MSKATKQNDHEVNSTEEQKGKCGIVMPISEIDGCSESHWQEVLNIVKDSVSEAGFEGELVSLSADVGVIQRRIVKNLYENPVVVCDVSGKNPNVMFELGLRLAFDKPTIIIKDDMTAYSFDTSPIEHLEYPRSLRHPSIVEFKAQLASKITATYQKSVDDRDYSPFLRHFGDFKVPKIDSTEVTPQEYIIKELREIKEFMFRQEFINNKMSSFLNSSSHSKITLIHAEEFDDLERAKYFCDMLTGLRGVRSAEINPDGSKFSVEIKHSTEIKPMELRRLRELTTKKYEKDIRE